MLSLPRRVLPFRRLFRQVSSKSSDGDGKDSTVDKVASPEPTVPDHVKSVSRSDHRSINRPKPDPDVDLARTPCNYRLSVPDPSKQSLQKTLYTKPFESTYVANRPIEDPMWRTIDMLKLKKNRKTPFLKEGFNAFYDFCIIGGGIMGCSVAYWLATRMYGQMRICVVEKDPDYRHAATTLSLGCLRQQYSTPENIEMSLFGADFLRNANRLLHIYGNPPLDIQFQPHGCLFLADESQAEQMEMDHAMQLQLGVKSQLLLPKTLKKRFPWISAEGVALASYGYENEGWYNPWALMAAMKMKAIDLGVHFIPGDVYNIAHRVNTNRIYRDTPEDEAEDERLRKRNRIEEAHIYLNDGDVWPVTASQFIVCAGAESGHIAHLAGVGSGDDVLRLPLPVEPRKRFTYFVQQERGPGLNCPVVVDPSGAYFRREGYGGMYMCGRPPAGDEEEPDFTNSEVDYDWFDRKVWPELAKRVPAFKELEMHSAAAHFYDYNYYDQCPVIGVHPIHSNLYFATGLTGQGIQQAPAIGRAIMEVVLDGKYESLDLNRFHFARFMGEIEREKEFNTFM